MRPELPERILVKLPQTSCGVRHHRSLACVSFILCRFVCHRWLLPTACAGLVLHKEDSRLTKTWQVFRHHTVTRVGSLNAMSTRLQRREAMPVCATPVSFDTQCVRTAVRNDGWASTHV